MSFHYANYLQLSLSEEECINEKQTYTDDIFPQIFKYVENDTWIVCDYVLPAKSADFKHCFGLTFNQFRSFISACGVERFGNFSWGAMDGDKYRNLINNNEYLSAFDEYIGDENPIVIGDMLRLVNYGLTMRFGETAIVLLDSGFSEEVWEKYHKK